MPHRVNELHSIQAIDNVSSIMTHGLLSHNAVSRYPHVNISMSVVQNRRSGVPIPGVGQLHSYACLYLHARNPMMRKRCSMASDLVGYSGLFVQ
ncbi:MAG: DUF4433 domain-containing protein [Candidatus Marinimicrobia bacterium]|nr:DUF4433 domain-containing protein [Candidatus Neomarinimicrobiota bacterium]